MPLTSLSVSSKDFSGQMRPSKPSGMPMTFHPYLMMAALVAARITALRPGASPPPVPIPMQRMSDIGFRSLWQVSWGLAFFDHTGPFGDGNLRVGIGLPLAAREFIRLRESPASCELREQNELRGSSERAEIPIASQERNILVEAAL